MTAEPMSIQPSLSNAEHAFLDTEEWEEQCLADEYLCLCNTTAAHITSYLRRQPTDIATASRFFAALSIWNRNAWIHADHQQRLQIIETMELILRQIADTTSTSVNPQFNRMTVKLEKECCRFRETLRCIHQTMLFDMVPDPFWDGEMDEC